MIVPGYKCFIMGISHVCSDASLDLICSVAYFYPPLHSLLARISMLFCVLILVLIKVGSVIIGLFTDFAVQYSSLVSSTVFINLFLASLHNPTLVTHKYLRLLKISFYPKLMENCSYLIYRYMFTHYSEIIRIYGKLFHQKVINTIPNSKTI